MMKKRKNIFPYMALAISVGGFALFYLAPFLISLVYAFTDNPIHMKFAGLKNFIELFQNEFFLRGLKNTAIFMGFAIPLSMLSSFLLALALKKLIKSGNLFSVLFLLPFLLPSATTAQFWRQIFGGDGLLNMLLEQFGMQGRVWLAGNETRGVMVFIYIWKNMGYYAILFLAGLHAIPDSYYDCAAVFGANAWQRFRCITLVYLTPCTFIVFILSFVNCFKIFREVYLLGGEFPPESVYLLQHFVNNNLLSLQYQRLVSGVYVLTFFIVIIIGAAFYIEKRTSENLREQGA